jgi:hypothetical protein
MQTSSVIETWAWPRWRFLTAERYAPQRRRRSPAVRDMFLELIDPQVDEVIDLAHRRQLAGLCRGCPITQLHGQAVRGCGLGLAGRRELTDMTVVVTEARGRTPADELALGIPLFGSGSDVAPCPDQAAACSSQPSTIGDQWRLNARPRRNRANRERCEAMREASHKGERSGGFGRHRHTTTGPGPSRSGAGSANWPGKS